MFQSGSSSQPGGREALAVSPVCSTGFACFSEAVIEGVGRGGLYGSPLGADFVSSSGRLVEVNWRHRKNRMCWKEAMLDWRTPWLARTAVNLLWEY